MKLEEIMGTLATIKFGLGIALILLGALGTAFFCYMSTFGKKSSLRQNNFVVTDKSV
jgi:uncharacterized YccA/Bax inhibitor family protein